MASIVPLADAAQETAVRTFNAAIPGVVRTRASAGKHVYFTDMHAVLTTADLADGIHPTAAGYAKMADAWYDALRSTPGAVTAPSTTPTTPAPTTTPTTSPTSAGARTATFALVGQRPDGFQAAVQVVNGGSPISSWSVAWTPSGYTVAQAWGAAVATSGSIVVARNESWNGSLPARGTTEFGFLGTGAAPASPPPTCTA